MSGQDSSTASSELDALWVGYNEEALSAFFQGRHVMAIELWDKARALTRHFEHDDPRLACSLNNRSVGFRLIEELKKAEQGYRRAKHLWNKSVDWIADMEVQRRARSSLFHLRLEQKHREQYDHFARLQYQKFVMLGYAGTIANLAEMCQVTGRTKEASELYEEARQSRLQALGDDDSDCNPFQGDISGHFFQKPGSGSQSAMDRNVPAVAKPFSLLAWQKGWVIDLPPQFTDLGRLMSAIVLTCLVDGRTCVGCVQR